MSIRERIGAIRVQRIAKRHREQRARVEREFGALFDEVSRLLSEADPIGVNFGVAKEVEAFFTMCLDNLQSKGLSSEQASELLATIAGAMVVANALGDLTYYDRATHPPSGGR